MLRFAPHVLTVSILSITVCFFNINDFLCRVESFLKSEKIFKIHRPIFTEKMLE